MNWKGSRTNAGRLTCKVVPLVVWAITALTHAGPVGAADVSARAPEPELLDLLPSLTNLRTVIDISGPIEPGDATKFAELVERLDPASMDVGPRGVEMVVRLDSPGGVFSEGIEIARIIDREKLQTLVAAGSECLSACAVIFMAGTYQPGFRQQEVAFRKVEWPVELGFHRPFMSVAPSLPPELLRELSPDEVTEFLSGEFANAFDVANELILRMVAVDPPDWSPELLVEMLTATEASDDGRFVYLETVGDALSWQIDVLNAVRPDPRNRYDMYIENFWMCYNSGRQDPAYTGIWQDRLATEETLSNFSRDCCGRQGATWDSKMIEDDNLTFYTRVRGLYFGCTISYESEESAPLITYFHDDTVKKGAPFLARYNPGTPLDHAVSLPPETTESDPLRSQILAGGRDGECTIFSGLEVLETLPCRQFPVTDSEWGIVDKIQFPSGRVTVVTRRNAAFEEALTVNGRPATNDREGRDGPWFFCLKNSDTGKTLCFNRPTVPH